MKIYRELDEIKEPFQNACVTIGNFDGVHLGHQRLFDIVEQRAYHSHGQVLQSLLIRIPYKYCGLVESS